MDTNTPVQQRHQFPLGIGLPSWLLGQAPRNERHDRDRPPPPLPSQRQRPITPLASRPYISQMQSQFFSLLPPEIRYDILRYAFGGGTVHAELTFEHPFRTRPRIRPKQPETDLWSPAHDIVYQRMMSEPRRWAWRSSACPCHARLTPPAHVWWHEHWHEPEVDVDLRKATDDSLCKTWAGVWPLRRRVGAMGWLTSCHQA